MSGFIVALLVLCIACYTGQTFLNRSFSTAYDGPANTATSVYAALYGLIVSAITLCLMGFHFSPSGTTVLLGCVNGGMLFLYNLGMVHAAPQMAGIALMLAAFVVLNSGGIDRRSVKRGYFFWVISLFFTNGLYGVLMDAQQRQFPQERNEMIVITFFASGPPPPSTWPTCWPPGGGRPRQRSG